MPQALPPRVALIERKEEDRLNAALCVAPAVVSRRSFSGAGEIRLDTHTARVGSAPVPTAVAVLAVELPDSADDPSGRPSVDSALRERFEQLAMEWRRDTAFTSSASNLVDHPAYQEIIALGPPVIPLLLAELVRNPNHWFFALRQLTGENPVAPEDRGRIKKMAEAWLCWARSKGIRW